MVKSLKYGINIIVLIVITFIGVFSTSGKNSETRKNNYTLSNDIKLHLADSILSYANTFKGLRYGYNKAGFGRFDCSGFTCYIFSKFGYSLNRSSRGQFLEGDDVNSAKLLPGDLVFFGGSRGTKSVGHVGIVVSVKGKGFDFIHASRNGIRVSSFPEENYYSNRYIGARRILSEKEDPQLDKLEKKVNMIDKGESLLDVNYKKKPKGYKFNIPAIEALSFEQTK